MVDKLDLEIPYGMPFRAEFYKAWYGPDNEKIFQKRSGGLYAVSSDLRHLKIPARLSVEHRHHKKLGPKLEIYETGDKTFSAWAEVHDQIFKGEAWDDAILRADLTADVRGIPVGKFERAMWCKFKHTTQQEYGEPGERTLEELDELACSYSRFDAQTLYYGRKPRQVRVYDKTRHRSKVLLPKIHKQQRKHGEELSTFRDEWGYDPREVVTRIERQMGAREPAKAWGVSYLGEIHKLMKCDPFERLKLASDLRGPGPELAELEGSRAMLIDLLRERIERTGLEDARAWARAKFPIARSYRKFWAENEHLILSNAGAAITGEELTREYRRTLEMQLAA